MTRSYLAPAPFAQHRHPRCVTPPSGTSIPPDDTATIAELHRQLAEVTADRDGLLLAVSRIAEACGLPEGTEIDKVIQRIEELA
ncbi:MAG: hypothetical protein ABR520_11350 [Mycobacteriales bacterium]|nr:hypothetical protein [Actinomycetota bacterium]